MTREQLIAENEALHGLLAHACEVLDRIARWDCDFFPEDAWRHIGEAEDVLAQIKEGAV